MGIARRPCTSGATTRKRARDGGRSSCLAACSRGQRTRYDGVSAWTVRLCTRSRLCSGGWYRGDSARGRRARAREEQRGTRVHTDLAEALSVVSPASKGYGCQSLRGGGALEGTHCARPRRHRNAQRDTAAAHGRSQDGKNAREGGPPARILRQWLLNGEKGMHTEQWGSTVEGGRGMILRRSGCTSAGQSKERAFIARTGEEPADDSERVEDASFTSAREGLGLIGPSPSDGVEHREWRIRYESVESPFSLKVRMVEKSYDAPPSVATTLGIVPGASRLSSTKTGGRGSHALQGGEGGERGWAEGKGGSVGSGWGCWAEGRGAQGPTAMLAAYSYSCSLPVNEYGWMELGGARRTVFGHPGHATKNASLETQTEVREPSRGVQEEPRRIPERSLNSADKRQLHSLRALVFSAQSPPRPNP
ncbi:hypothetical protein DFH09DRAFT_1082243 [Mycena vulgaris]|nr:hypothetical protein DFH09DRAFT_1082243 [Mycena vulgaris]